MDEKKIVDRLSRVGIFGNILLAAFKLFAGIFGKSGAMVSDAVHSLSDVFATLIAWIGVRLSRRAEDAEHPYGHERLECVASLLLGLILAGTGIAAGMGLLGRSAPALREKALTMCVVKMDDSLLSLFVLGILCNILIYIAVDGYRRNPHELGKYLSLFFGVMVFILSGTEHCVADMFYFWIAGVWGGRAVLCILAITLGNAAGGIVFATLHRVVMNAAK